MTGTLEEDVRALSLENDSYERLYKRLTDMSRSATDFYIQFEQRDPIKAFRLYKQDKPTYDRFGRIITGVKFVLVDEFSELKVKSEEEYNRLVATKKEIVLSRENIPSKIWQQTRTRGMVEISW